MKAKAGDVIPRGRRDTASAMKFGPVRPASPQLTGYHDARTGRRLSAEIAEAMVEGGAATAAAAGVAKCRRPAWGELHVAGEACVTPVKVGF